MSIDERLEMLVHTSASRESNRNRLSGMQPPAAADIQRLTQVTASHEENVCRTFQTISEMSSAVPRLSDVVLDHEKRVSNLEGRKI